MIRRWWSAALFVVAVLGGCTSDDNAGPSQSEFSELMDGVPSDSAHYELTVVDCFNDGEFVDFTWGLTNLSDSAKTFAFDVYLTSVDGEVIDIGRELVGDPVEAGAYMEWSGFTGRGELFPLGDEIECRFEVLDSVFGAFRDEE